MKRKYLLLFVIGLIIIGVAVWLYNYLSYGSVDIRTNDAVGTITLTKVGQPNPIKQAQKQINVRLHTGQYIASVQGNSTGTSQIVDVKAHKTERYILTPTQPHGVEPVIDVAGRDVTAGANLYYVDNTTQNLYQINSSNVSGAISDHVQFSSVKWMSGGTGVGQDSSGRLYSISNGSVKQLTLPTKQANYFAVSSSGQVYFSNGLNLYKGTIDGSFTKIYTAKTPFSSLAAANRGVAVIASPIADSPSSYKKYVAFVDDSGAVTQKGIIVSDSAVWSPNGKYLATLGNLNYQIFNNKLDLVANIPNTGASNPVWVGDHTLLYSLKDQLWRYDLSTQRANLIANMPLGESISQMTLSDDKSYAYLSVSGVDGFSPSIKRVGLNGQTVQPVVFKLQSVLPKYIEGCYLDLINFAGPTVTTKPAYSSLNQYCLQSAKNDLSEDGFDISKLGFATVPI